MAAEGNGLQFVVLDEGGLGVRHRMILLAWLSAGRDTSRAPAGPGAQGGRQRTDRILWMMVRGCAIHPADHHHFVGSNSCAAQRVSLSTQSLRSYVNLRNKTS